VTITLEGKTDPFATDHLRSDLGTRSLRSGAVTLFSQGLKFLISVTTTMVLARLLTPSDYGLMGMVAILTGFVGLFRDLGLSTATIQRPEINHRQVSTLFWLNATLGLATALLTCLAAPAIAWFYREPQLVAIAVGLSTTFVLGGFTMQHQALLRRQMRFAALAAIDITALLAGMATGIGLAAAGARHWALVYAQIAIAATTLVAAWIACSWRPGRPQRHVGTMPMIVFGANITGANVVNYFARNLDNALIGRYWGAAPLGLYSKAYQLLLLPLDQINSPVTAVAVPVLSRMAHEPEAYRRAYRRMLQMLTLVTVPGMAFMIAAADWIVLIVLGPQWTGVSPIFMCLAASAPALVVCDTTGWLFVTQGRTNDMLKWTVIGVPLLVVGIVAGLAWGPIGVAISYSTTMLLVIAPLLFWFASQKGPVKQRDFYDVLLPLALPSAALIAAVTAIRYWTQMGPLPSLLAALPCGAITFLGVLALTRRGRDILGDVKHFQRLIKGHETWTDTAVGAGT
jgi:PST family polysaccharide transporter